VFLKKTVRRCVPSTVAKKGPDIFDRALQVAYLDEAGTTHSLVSGLRLISLCRTQTKAGTGRFFEPATAQAACYIAALCMMFHDQGCREALRSAGIPPIAYEHLPYAAVLMFVDSLQDDRRDIQISRFQNHGVLDSVRVSADRRSVTAVVCLPELTVDEWAKRIVEYESVMKWVNTESEIRFEVDYRTRTRSGRSRPSGGPRGRSQRSKRRSTRSARPK